MDTKQGIAPSTIDTSPSSTPITSPNLIEQKQQHKTSRSCKHDDPNKVTTQPVSQRRKPQPPSQPPQSSTLPSTWKSQTQPSLSPKVTVSLPRHAASRLRELVQRRDIALIQLGIISVQFDGDQIIPLTLNAPVSNSATAEQTLECVDPIVETPQTTCNDDCMSNLDTSTEPHTGLTSPNHAPNLDANNHLKPITKNPDCNTGNLAPVYDDDDDDKNEDEVVSEVENQHSSSYDIHQLSQLEFADPIELEMYDSDNLLFSDYTLNLS